MRVDVHCHIVHYRRPCQAGQRFTFEPVDGPLGDGCLSDKMISGLKYLGLKWLLGLPLRIPRADLDDVLDRFWCEQVLGAHEVDRVVALAFDQYHTASGQPAGLRRTRRPGTDLYVSNTLARSLWRQHPQRVLFGASIHPYRVAEGMPAEAMLEEVAHSGAVLVKWLPVNQNIDVRDPRSMRFLRRAAELGMPMLIHYGGEKALGRHHPELEDPGPLLATLRELRDEGRMPTVIVAHVATPSLWPLESARGFRTLVDALLGEFAEAPLYADISGMALPNRSRWLKKALSIPRLHKKLVHGSDFPIPSTPWAFRRSLGERYHEVKALRSWLDRDILLKSALGVGEEVFTRGGVLLRHRIQAADAWVQDRRAAGVDSPAAT